MIIFLDFIKSKLRPKKKILRHGSLHLNALCRFMKFYGCEMNIKRDILVQKIKVKKSIFKFLPPRFVTFLPIVILLIGLDSSFFWLFNDI